MIWVCAVAFLGGAGGVVGEWRLLLVDVAWELVVSCLCGLALVVQLLRGVERWVVRNLSGTV